MNWSSSAEQADVTCLLDEAWLEESQDTSRQDTSRQGPRYRQSLCQSSSLYGIIRRYLSKGAVVCKLRSASTMPAKETTKTINS